MKTFRYVTIKDIAIVKGGKRLSKGHYLLNYKTKYPYIRLVDIVNHQVDKTNLLYLSEETRTKISRYVVNSNDVCLAIVGNTIGLVFYITDEFDDVNLTENAAKITDFTDTDPKFVFYYLRSKFGQYEIASRAVGSAQGKLPIYAIENIRIPYPTLDEQKLISSILSTLDAKIYLLCRQNKTLEQIAQTLFKRWFVEFEFPNKEGKPYKSSGGEMVSSELGEIPEGWRLGKFGDEFKIVMGQSPPGESYNEKKEGMIFFQGRTDFGFRFPSIRLYTNQPKRVAKKFDVLVSVRAPVGDVNIAMDDCCIGRGLSAVSSEYKSYCLYKIKSLKSIFNLFESEGTVFGALNKDNFHNIDSIIPELGVVIQFERITHPIDAKIYNNELELRNLTTIRDLLLPKLMSGQIRVNG